MTRGRRPTPIHLRLLKGTVTPEQVEQQQLAQPEGDLVAPPHHMTERQKNLWRTALKAAPDGLLKELDRAVFEQWVIHYDTHQEASQKVASMGLLVKSPGSGTPMQNPYLSIMNKQAQILIKLQAEMGFTPSSRSRVKVDPKAKKRGAANPFADLKSLTDD